MSLNILDIVLLVILAVSVISGMYKGFLASLLATVGFAAAFFGAQSLYPQLAAAIQGNTSLMNVITYYLDASSMFKTVGLADTTVEAANAAGGRLLEQAVRELSSLPSAMVNAFQTNVSNFRFSNLGFVKLSDYLNQTVISSAVNVVSFLVLFLVAYVVLLLVVNLLNNVFHFPLLKHFDWLLGGVFGLARGAVIAALLIAVLPMILSVIDIDIINTLMKESAVVQAFPKDFAVADIIMKAFQRL
ncbi:MAG: CvpA family protein [Clostridia bacterium]|nr:CvpA family protein [Clostridia bacterium]